MKSVVFLAVIAFAVADMQYYDLDKLDMDKISKDPSEFARLVGCLLDYGPCTPLYSKYKAVTEEAIESFCLKCSPYQKHTYWQFLQALKSIFPNEYINYKHKYDTDDRYFSILEAVLSQFKDSY